MGTEEHCFDAQGMEGHTLAAVAERISLELLVEAFAVAFEVEHTEAEAEHTVEELKEFVDTRMDSASFKVT